MFAGKFKFGKNYFITIVTITKIKFEKDEEIVFVDNSTYIRNSGIFPA
jgi:hypothetical protein